MKLNKYIKDYRKFHNLTLQDFAETAGLSKAYVSILEKEVRPQNNKKIVPSIETIKKIASATGKTLNELILLLNADEQIAVNDEIPSNIIPVKKGTRKIPVLGSIAAGQPIEAIEDIVDYVYIPEAWQDDFIALKIEGNSMSPTIPNESTVIIRLQDDAESGDIVAVYINGYDATCKKLQKLEEGGIVLISLNPSYEPMAYTNKEVLELPIRILGKVVEVRTKI